MLINNLKLFCERSRKYKTAFSSVLENPEVDDSTQQKVFALLCKFLLDPESTVDVAECFPQFVLILLSMAIVRNCKQFSGYEYADHLHKLNSVVLGKLIQINPDVQGFLLQYFDTNPAPFESITEVTDSAQKRFKLDVSQISIPKVSDYDIVLACYNILKLLPEHFKQKWNWSKFYLYLNNGEDAVKWVALKCITMIFDMSEVTRLQCAESLIQNVENFLVKEIPQCKNTVLLPSGQTLEERQRELENIISKKNLPIVCVAGVPLLVFNNTNKSVEGTDLVTVPSLQENLQTLALAVATGKCICLQGPVGCGKTAIVEYLAKKTGHVTSTNFVKVQLGDQTDSKMLLGMYVCSDIPGEFIWQPGVLTQAVTEGKWLLLEDIDCAPLDVASILSNLLETKTLSVPGYRETIRAKNGFQLFVTQRLTFSASGLHRKIFSSTSSLLDKHWLRVNMEPLSRNELVHVVETLFPHLKTVSEKMVDAFLISTNCDNESENSFKSGRVNSTRDLIKWCLRSIVDFDVSSPKTAECIFQDAIDIFCCSIPNQEKRLTLATTIGHMLGKTTSLAEHFCKVYKPSVSTIISDHFVIGRASLPYKKQLFAQCDDNYRFKFSFTRPSACLLERVATCVARKEPVLLVGETGTGKTSSVQYLAHKTGHKLLVINMNQQSESADLLGGYKPIDLKYYITPIRQDFEILFRSYFAIEPNQKFLNGIAKCYEKCQWKTLVKVMIAGTSRAIERLRREKSHYEVLKQWEIMAEKLNKLKTQVKAKHSLAFTFVEGSLVKALREGYWVLLDEINLANAETLECLSGLLDGASGSLSLLERGDREMIKRHPDFTIFACMNPATDVGKKELPVGLRNRFTEFFVDELTQRADLQMLVKTYLENLNIQSEKQNDIVSFYLNVRKEAQMTLSDGTGHRPHYSLRTLCRALNIAVTNNCNSILRSLYEGFCLSFLTQLNDTSYPIVHNMIKSTIFKGKKNELAVLKAPIPKPMSRYDGEEYINFEGYWIVRGSLNPETPVNYILTESVKRNLRDLARIVSIGKMPALLQGDTSVGKTSLIMYLAKAAGHVCVRINNHEHTDLQEYVGSYVADATGKLVFKDGILVEAMRKGYWIILDELNLAPSDVLEALNRVLDDNGELFIPETQQVVKAHRNFMLFATQNPPGVYGGRKILSRAFRNRFVELHFDEIPTEELQIILHKRCSMPESYCKQVLNVMKELQIKRKSTDAFAGKKGFITLRDLFRWGERYRLAPENSENLYDWSQHLADEGYLVLAAKVRKSEEADEIRQAIKKHLKRDVDPNNLFSLHENTSLVTRHILKKIMDAGNNFPEFKHVVWTYQMRRMAVLVMKSCQFKEPVLLVGETGGGKTTICQLVAALNGQTMRSVNCHMHTESSDFLGNLRPVRDRVSEKLFEWVDGPLITAMQEGGLFLADEISLADDSVLERLNSLLEPERSLLLTERGFDGTDGNKISDDTIIADGKFFFIGTMNPGGDFGKKELSPALRNRFTEIWCASCTERDDLQAIAEHNISLSNEDLKRTVAEYMLDFVEFLTTSELGKKFVISIRDIINWVNFINVCINLDKTCRLNISDAYMHAACLTYIDGLGSGITSVESSKKLNNLRDEALKLLKSQVNKLSKMELLDESSVSSNMLIEMDSSYFGIHPFYIEKGSAGTPESCQSFTFEASTTKNNALKVLRALQLNKPILLEGSPGVGKTSLVSAIANASGNPLLRINLSDQTDMSDLFGADLPVENGRAGEFAWRNGPFLRALQAGHWILLDELNLASQSVLEGLNACFDHRGEIYIPELNKTFHVKTGTKFFACQNPLRQGGGRRGLPKSFLNRFAQVFVDVLCDNDLMFIIHNQFPELPKELIRTMIDFNSKVSREAGIEWGHSGSPWEMNLRDLTRWCEATIASVREKPVDTRPHFYNPGQYIELIYVDRMRTVTDKDRIRCIYQEMFGDRYELPPRQPLIRVTDEEYCIGDTTLQRTSSSLYNEDHLLLLRNQMPILRSLARCVKMNWMTILVGGSGSGKSSVVQALASMAGQSLKSIAVNSAMDTTEILGSFEQTDYNRHLEGLFERVQKLLMDGLRFRLENKDFQKLQWHHERLEEVRCIFMEEPNTEITMTMATENFLCKVSKLLELVETMKIDKLGKVDELRQIEEGLRNLVTLVKQDRCLNAGGKFEWVDSLLVKCLQEGSWLMIDQVNFCNPAVLDRLNGLLEPNGVLSVGERGVDSQGNVVTIKPHKNFRLFLTMDPRYGEISRAMRNRGVEIYLLSEKDNQIQNSIDQKSMLLKIGLVEKNQHDALLKVHRRISEHISTFESFSLSQLTHSAFLIAQRISRGFPPKEAFISACVDVYLKARFINDSQTRKYVTDMIEEVIDEYKLCTSNEGVWDRKVIDLAAATCNINDLQENARMTVIRQQGFLLTWTLNVFRTLKNNTSYFLNDFLDSGSSKSEQMLNIDVAVLLPYFLLHFYEQSALNDVELRKRWLENMLPADNCDTLLQMVKDKNKVITNEILSFNFNKRKEKLPWNVAFFDKDDNERILEANRLALLLYFTTMILNDTNVTMEDCFVNPTKKVVSVMEYSNAVYQKKLVPQMTGQPLITNYAILLSHLKKGLYFILKNTCINTDSKSFAFLRKNLKWLSRFEKLGELKLQRSKNSFSNIDEISLLLRVYYKWVIKCIPNFITPQNSEKEEVKLLLNTIKFMNNNLPSVHNPFRKVSKSVKKSMFNLTPHPEESSIEVHSTLQSVTKLFFPWVQNEGFCEPREEVMQALQNSEDITNKNHSLALLWRDFYLGKTFDANAFNSLTEIKSFCEQNNLHSDSMLNRIADETELSYQKEITKFSNNVQLWPVYEYLFLVNAFCIQRKFYQGMNVNSNMFSADNIIEKLIGVLSIPANLLALLSVILEKREEIDYQDTCLLPMLYYYLTRCIQNMYITKPNVQTILKARELSSDIYRDQRMEIKSNSVNGSIFVKFITKLLLNHSAYDLTAANIATATLESFRTQIIQLQTLNAILWSNSVALNCPDFQYELNDLKILKSHSNVFLSASQKANEILERNTDREFSNVSRDYLLPLKELQDIMKNVEEATTDPLKQGRAWFLLGYLQVFLFTNIGCIDPVHKVGLKLQHIEEDIDDCRKCIYVALLNLKLQGLENKQERIEAMEKILETLLEEKNMLSNFKAARPNNKEFIALCKSFSNFINVLGSYETVNLYVKRLFDVALKVQDNITAAEDTIEEAVTWQESSSRFMEEVERRFLPGYPDIAIPVLSSLSQMKHGINLLINEIERRLSVFKSTHGTATVQSLIFNFMRFPTIGIGQENLLELVTLCTSHSTRQLLNKNLQSTFSLREQFRVTLAGLRELQNYVILNGKLSKSLWNTLNDLLRQVVLIWTQQQKEIEELETEKNSWYKHKLSNPAEITEDEMIQAELENLFPTYRDHDFADIDTNQMHTLGDNKKSHADDSDKKDSTSLISESDIREIEKIHSNIVTSFTVSTWLKRYTKNRPDYLQPFVQRYSTCGLLLENVPQALNSSISLELCPSLNLLTQMSLRICSGEKFAVNGVTERRKTYDFYQDNNVEEVKKCIPLLEKALDKVKQLLQNWPEHPTLISIETIIMRIYGFPITSPVSRFLTGLELLLVKMQEWEENAHSGVSLVEYSHPLTQQIIAWRQLELACWKDCLNVAHERLRSQASKWWFYLYSLFENYSMECSNPDASSNTKTQLVQSLQKFMNESPIIEFQFRLGLIFTFHCHIYHTTESPKKKELLAITWNLHNYYSELMSQVDDRISELKLPIQKSLRDFVKIARWNDINYWSVKETVHKTHKTLHSFIKKYETGLKENVAACFFIKPTVDAVLPNPLANGLKRSANTDDFIVPHITVESQIDTDSTNVDLIKRIASFARKARKLCGEIILNSSYPEIREDLNDLVDQFMEHSSKLKSIDIGRTLPKPEQKARAKSVLTQKKAALADYFKTLTSLGVSYRTGILKLKNKEEEVISLEAPPLDPTVALQRLQEKKGDRRILKHWEGCDKYYYKSLNMLNTLNSLSYSSHVGLGPQDFERFRGFSAHLMLMVHQLRQSFNGSWRHFISFRKLLTDFSRYDRNLKLNKLHNLQECAGNFKQLIITSRIILDQLQLYLQSCPEPVNSQSKEIYALQKTGVPMDSCKRNDDLWNSANSLLEQGLVVVSTVSKSFELTFPEESHDDQLTVITVDHTKFLSDSYNAFKQLKQIVHDLANMFAIPNQTSHPIYSSIIFLETRINNSLKVYDELEQENANSDDENSLVSEFEIKLERTVRECLLVVQAKYKNVNNKDEDCEKNQLSEKLIKSIKEDINILKLEDVTNNFNDLLSLMLKQSQCSTDYCIRLLSTCLPLFEQYLLFSQFYLCEQLASLRITCKLLYLQLNVFLDLAANGFCIPKDLDIEDEGNEDSSGTVDKGGMGLGDGEGQQDVSDRIENEDQLDEAKLPNQEKEEQSNSDSKDDGKGIEMSENFDGDLQDIEKPEDDEDQDKNDEDDDDDLDKEMGETSEGADKLDEQIWGDDDEEVNEEPEKDQNEDLGKGEQTGKKELDAKDGNDDQEGADDKNNRDKSEQPEKEINEMKEPEENDDYIDPYHGQQQKEPEIEPMDLPDDINLDDEEVKENNPEQQDPFDIDQMKDVMDPPEKKDEENAEGEKDNDKENENTGHSSDSEDETETSEVNPNEPTVDTPEENDNDAATKDSNKMDIDEDKNKEEEENKGDEEDKALPSLDDGSKEMDKSDQVSSDAVGSKDNVNQKPEDENAHDEAVDTCQQDVDNDKGTGQAHSEQQDSGHSGSMLQDMTTQMMQQGTEAQRDDKRKKPGQGDEDRALVDELDPKRKKLKTMIMPQDKIPKNDEEDQDIKDGENKESDMYQHVTSSEKCDQHAMDAATEDQSKQQPSQMDEEQSQETAMEVEETMEEEPENPDENNVEHLDPEKLQNNETKMNNKNARFSEKQDEPQDVANEEVNVEGEVVETMKVDRGIESEFCTRISDLDSSVSALTPKEIEQRRLEMTIKLNQWKQIPSTEEAVVTWNTLNAIIDSSARDLSEKLRLILEPTQASQLKGDYKTGKRINMRKIISYIASQFMKDKIWLRRTKPSKRDYQIVLAIDDSSSMADNHSKEMAFESLALISKALTYLEAGELSVISFGECVNILHPLGVPFSESSGSLLMQQMRFDQKKTMVGQLVHSAVDMFESQPSSSDSAKLVVILSDGRGVFSEGTEVVNQAVRRAKLADIFLVFVIVDNPMSKDSILDIRMPIFQNGKLLEIQSYMDRFPFPFYIILRDINALPGVLSDALRQWFEVVGTSTN